MFARHQSSRLGEWTFVRYRQVFERRISAVAGSGNSRCSTSGTLTRSGGHTKSGWFAENLVSPVETTPERCRSG
jgi:hypothetical protein